LGGGEMTLNESDVKAVVKAVEQIGAFGKVTLVINDGFLFDIAIEKRIRLFNGEKLEGKNESA
jgi:hypothetical protein